MSEVKAAKAPKEVKPPVEVTVSGVLAMLDRGLDREKIKAELGISHSDMALLFKEPELKGRKPKGTVRVKKAPGFILVKDVATGTTPAPEAGLTDAALAQDSAIVEQPITSTDAPVTAPQGQASEIDKW